MSYAHRKTKASTLRLVVLILIVAALALLLLFSNRQVASQGQTSVFNSYGTRSVTPEPFGRAKVTPRPSHSEAKQLMRPEGATLEPFGRAGVTPLPFRKGVAPRGVTPEPFGRAGVTPLPW